MGLGRDAEQSRFGGRADHVIPINRSACPACLRTLSSPVTPVAWRRPFSSCNLTDPKWLSTVMPLHVSETHDSISLSEFLFLAKTPSYLQPTASTAQRAASAPAFKRTWPPPRHVPPQPRAPLASAKESQPISGDDPFSKEGSKSSMPKSRAVSWEREITRASKTDGSLSF